MASKPVEDSLIADLEATPPAYSGGMCKVRVIMDNMSPERQESLEKHIERVRTDMGQGRSKSYSASWLTRILRKHGYNISVSTVQRHVNKECPCGRNA